MPEVTDVGPVTSGVVPTQSPEEQQAAESRKALMARLQEHEAREESVRRLLGARESECEDLRQELQAVIAYNEVLRTALQQPSDKAF